MRRRETLLWAFVVAVALAIVAAGCGGGAKTTAAGGAGAATPEGAAGEAPGGAAAGGGGAEAAAGGGAVGPGGGAPGPGPGPGAAGAGGAGAGAGPGGAGGPGGPGGAGGAGGADPGGGGGAAAGGPTSAPGGGPLVDGLYVSPSTDGQGGQIGWDYIRFFPDGSVVTISTPGGPDAALGHLRPDDDLPGKGKWALDQGLIRFVAQSNYGAVEYLARPQQGGLEVVWRSHINGVQSGGQYNYLPFPKDDGSGAAAGGAAAGAGGGADTAPEEALKPPGSGWYCTKPLARRSGVTSRCARSSQECQTYRRWASARRGHPRMSACAQQEQAACHTIDSPKTGPEVSCFATPDECVRAITTLRSRKSTSKISDCIAW